MSHADSFLDSVDRSFLNDKVGFHDYRGIRIMVGSMDCRFTFQNRDYERYTVKACEKLIDELLQSLDEVSQANVVYGDQRPAPLHPIRQYVIG